MNDISIKLLAAGGFLIICLVCILGKAGKIENDLRARCLAALRLEGITLERVSVSGRDAALAGRVPSREIADRAAEIAGAVYGVRKVIRRLEVIPPSAVELQTTLDQLIANYRIEFSADSDLSPPGLPLLELVAEALQQDSLARVEISGHTDSTGAEAFNLELSRRRAETVKAYLVGKGVNPGRLTTAGYGETRPLADNNTPEGRSKNRRVEFTVLKSEFE